MHFAGKLASVAATPLPRRVLREQLLLALAQLDALECDDSPAPGSHDEAAHDEAATPSAQVREGIVVAYLIQYAYLITHPRVTLHGLPAPRGELRALVHDVQYQRAAGVGR